MTPEEVAASFAADARDLRECRAVIAKIMASLDTCERLFLGMQDELARARRNDATLLHFPPLPLLHHHQRKASRMLNHIENLRLALGDPAIDLAHHLRARDACRDVIFRLIDERRFLRPVASFAAHGDTIIGLHGVVRPLLVAFEHRFYRDWLGRAHAAGLPYANLIAGFGGAIATASCVLGQAAINLRRYGERRPAPSDEAIAAFLDEPAAVRPAAPVVPLRPGLRRTG